MPKIKWSNSVLLLPDSVVQMSMLKKSGSVPPDSSGTCSNALGKPEFMMPSMKRTYEENSNHLAEAMTGLGCCYTEIHVMGNGRTDLMSRAKNLLLVRINCNS